MSTAEGGWIDRNGKPVAYSDTAKSIDGFSAALIVTPDKDWREKWNTPPETVPQFSLAKEVADGGELFILTFLSNPRLNAEGMTDVSCDFVVSRPDGTHSVSKADIPCFKVRLTTNPTYVYLSGASVKYVAEPKDARGTWTVAVTVKDRNRGVSIPLKTSFVVR